MLFNSSISYGDRVLCSIPIGDRCSFSLENVDYVEENLPMSKHISKYLYRLILRERDVKVSSLREHTELMWVKMMLCKKYA